MQVLGFNGMRRAVQPKQTRAVVRATAIERAAQIEARRLAALTAAADYEVARRAVGLNTERLKALRLARDAALAEQPRAGGKLPRA